MMPSARARLLLCLAVLPQLVVGTCFVAQTETIRRDVLAVVPQLTLAGCKILCIQDINASHYLLLSLQFRAFLMQITAVSRTLLLHFFPFQCQSTLLNAAGDACVLLGAQVPAPTDTCPAPFVAHVKTQSGCVDIPQGPIGVDYAPGECSRATDVVGDLATDGSFPACGTPTSDKLRTVIDAIQHDGTHVTLENYKFAYAVWDAVVGSWWLQLVDTANTPNDRYYFKTAKCVLAPIAPLSPACACSALPTQPAEPGNANPTPPTFDVVPCCASGWLQMSYLRLSDTSTWQSTTYEISCMMGTWMVTRTSGGYNLFAITAATCVE